MTRVEGVFILLAGLAVVVGLDIGPMMAAMEALSKNVIEHKQEGAL